MKGYEGMSSAGCARYLPASAVAVFGLGFVLQVFALGSAVAADDASSRLQAPAVENRLEGVRFIGPFGAEEEADPKEDVFAFENGKFSTASCLEWGFRPAPYWLRRDAKGLHFLAELKSPEHGTMRYEGVFDGKELVVVGYWKKERWYWTVERTYRGKGRPETRSGQR
jgi:hypothetical protein